MARARSPNRDKAFELWKNSKGNRKLIDIAEKLGVSDSQVRKWKTQDKWDEKVTLPNEKVTLPNEPAPKGNVTKQKAKKKRGGQRGNMNTVGHGAPKGNQNSYKHGLYANPTLDMIPEEDMDRLVQLDFKDEESLIIQEIILLTSREKQLLLSVDKAQDNPKCGSLCQMMQSEITKVQKEKRQYLAELRVYRTAMARMPKETDEEKESRILRSLSDEELQALIEGNEIDSG